MSLAPLPAWVCRENVAAALVETLHEWVPVYAGDGNREHYCRECGVDQTTENYMAICPGDPRAL